MKILITFCLVWCAWAHASLVSVESVYPDQLDGGRKIKVRGSGLLFAYESRYFVFTASHVSQGGDLAVRLGKRTLAVLNRQLHDSQDLELIEVEGVSAADVAARYDNGQFVYDLAKIDRKRQIDSYNLVPLLPWVVDPNLDADNLFAANRPSALYVNILSGFLHGGVLIQPGTSGAPLITVVPDRARWTQSTLPYDVREGITDVAPGTAVVRGIAIRRERFFASATFIHRPWMVELLGKYLKGEKSQAKFMWQAKGALLFRSMDGYQETNSFNAATAGGTVVDGGNGVGIDGGDLATLAEDSPKDFLNKVSAFPVIDNEPVIYWMIVMRHPKSGQMISFLTWFDMEFFPRMRRFTWQLGRTSVDLVSRLGPRLNKSTPYEITQPEYLKVDASGLLARLRDGDDVVEFKLNRDGAQCVNGTCEPTFQPVIETVSAHGLPYIVDLKELFFVDLGTSSVPALVQPGAENLSWDDVMAKSYDELALVYQRPRVSFRRKRTSVERPMTVSEGVKKTVQWGM